MLYLIAALGSHGDVHPFLGIAQRLRERGHSVAIIASALYQSLIQSVGLEFIPLGTVEQFEALTADPDLWHPTRGFHVVARGTSLLLPQLYRIIADRYQPGRTVLVMSTLALGARVAQEKLGIPGVSVHLSPAIFRSEYLSPKLPPLPLASWQPRWFKRTLYKFADQYGIDPHLAPAVNSLRAELGLPPIQRIFHDFIHSPQAVLGMFPAWFAPPQPDWPARTVLTGFPLYDERDITPLPPALNDFLGRGSAPVAFTPGSGMRHGQAFFAAAVAACKSLNCRGILLSRYAAHLPPSLPADMIQVDFAPFSALLPRCVALVHHGGIGTLSQALAAGIPQVVMPMAHDQADNADRLRRLGVAAVLPAKKLNGIKLAAALKEVLHSKVVAASCLTTARRFEGVDAIGAAANAIEAITAPPPLPGTIR